MGIWVTSIRNLNRRNCPPGRLLVSIDLRTDEIPATGGHRFFAHATTLYVIRYPKRSFGRISNLSKFRRNFGNNDRK